MKRKKEEEEGGRRLNSPGGSRRLDHTGSLALSQYPTGGGRMGGRGRPHRRLTAQWPLKMWLCRFLAGRHSQRGCPFPLLARGEPQGLCQGPLTQCGSLVWVLEWVPGSDPGRGKTQCRLVRPQGRVWAGGSQMWLG